jgi:hypothetical protein
MVSRESDRHEELLFGDGRAARAGVGVVIPPLLVGVLLYLLWPTGSSISPLGMAAIAFLATAFALAVLRAPRLAVIDAKRREIRLTIGWPPLGRRRIIPFNDIAEVKVWQPIRLGDDRLGAARPALMLANGSKVFLSTYNRSPKACREIADPVRALVFAPPRTGR